MPCCDGGAYLHQVGTHHLLSALFWVRAACEAQRLGKREEDATGTCGDRWDGGRQQALRQDQGVGQAQRGLAKHRHDGVSDAVAETRLDESTREPERNGDEPPASQLR